MDAWQCERSRQKQATSKRLEFVGYDDDDCDKNDDNGDVDEILTQNGSVVLFLV